MLSPTNPVSLGVSGEYTYQTIIILEPGKRSGEPTIRGMRITVYGVLSYLAAAMSLQEILDDFPYLAAEDS